MTAGHRESLESRGSRFHRDRHGAKLVSQMVQEARGWFGTMSNSQEFELQSREEKQLGGVQGRGHTGHQVGDPHPSRWFRARFCEIEKQGDSSLGEGNGRLIHRGSWEHSQRCWSQWGTGMLSWKETGVVTVSGPMKCVGSYNTTGMSMPIFTPSKTGMQTTTAKRIPTQQVGDCKVTTEPLLLGLHWRLRGKDKSHHGSRIQSFCL